jgi:hypothetical protein
MGGGKLMRQLGLMDTSGDLTRQTATLKNIKLGLFRKTWHRPFPVDSGVRRTFPDPVMCFHICDCTSFWLAVSAPFPIPTQFDEFYVRARAQLYGHVRPAPSE